MADVPLLTSLPPAIARQDAKGNEIGREYQRRCAESWREAGFLPISVNSAGEVEARQPSRRDQPDDQPLDARDRQFARRQQCQ